MQHQRSGVHLLTAKLGSCDLGLGVYDVFLSDGPTSVQVEADRAASHRVGEYPRVSVVLLESECMLGNRIQFQT